MTKAHRQIYPQRLRGAYYDDTKAIFAGNTLRDIADSNISYIKYVMERDRKQAIELLDTLNDSLLNGKDSQDIIDRSKAHIIFYEKWMVFNGCLLYVNDFRNLKVDKETRTVTATWREEKPEITIFGNKEYTRRLSEIYINSDNRTISFKIPGNTSKNGDRGRLFIQDSGPKNGPKNGNNGEKTVIRTDQEFKSITIRNHKKGDPTIPEHPSSASKIKGLSRSDTTLSGQTLVESPDTIPSQDSGESDSTDEISFPTASVQSVTVEAHQKEQGDTEIVSRVVVKTLPDSNMSLDNESLPLVSKYKERPELTAMPLADDRVRR